LRNIADHLPQASTARADEQSFDTAIDQCDPRRASGTENTAADSPQCCGCEVGKKAARQPLRRAIHWLDMLPDSIHRVDPELRGLSGTRARAESEETSPFLTTGGARSLLKAGWSRTCSRKQKQRISGLKRKRRKRP
jgi:hypothetical protein